VFDIDYLNRLRLAELELLRHYLPPLARLLEIRAGTGRQGLELRKHGFDVEMIDLTSSNYAAERLCEITNYDGRTIPFANATFGVVYPSNVLEHVADLTLLHSEVKRVPCPDGYAIHLVPTHYWRFWSIVSAFPAAAQRAYALRPELLPRAGLSRAAMASVAAAWLALARSLVSPFVPRRHGEHGNALTELWSFHPAWWRRNFANNGYRIVHEAPGQLFYTGSMVVGLRWSIDSLAAHASSTWSGRSEGIVRRQLSWNLWSCPTTPLLVPPGLKHDDVPQPEGAIAAPADMLLPFLAYRGRIQNSLAPQARFAQ